MKVSFDGQVLLKGNKTGIAWCAENILEQFSKFEDIDKTINYFTLGYSPDDKAEADKYGKKGFFLQRCGWFHDVLYRMMWNFLPLPYSMFFRRKVDATVFFNYVIPPGVKGKKIVFVHDMSYLACPETVRTKTRRFLNVSMKKSCHRADVIITISEFSKKEIIKYLGIQEEKIKTLPLGVDFNRFHTNYSEKEKNNVVQKYGLTQDYLLYLGTIEPRKNLERLIRAYAMTCEKNEMPPLIMAGRKGWLYEEIFNAVEELNLTEKVKFLGYVDSADVPMLISAAKVFLFPSVYEGFGLPVLEAMACGVPVITSDAASLPEVAGDAAVLVNPMDINDIADKILRVVEDKKLQKKMIEKGLLQAEKNSWENTAELLRKVIVAKEY